ncbi:hypothetical protein LINPERHAP2_LOCUS37398 [Linum perenne]
MGDDRCKLDAAPFVAVSSTRVNVPFSWEHKPGVSKLGHGDQLLPNLLPPPPLKWKNNTSYDEESRSSLEQRAAQDDPFLVAYWKCTDQETDGHDDGGGSRLITSSRRLSSSTATRKKMPTMSKGLTTMIWPSALSCKYYCGVRRDNLVLIRASNHHHHLRKNSSHASPTCYKEG